MFWQKRLKISIFILQMTGKRQDLNLTMNGKLRIAIVGTGSRGTHCFGKILLERPDVEIAAFCDPNPVRARSAMDFLKINLPLYSSVEEMAKKEKLDGAVITAPDYLHRNCAVAALRAGWNILIDKPLATNVRDGRDIIETARETGKTVMIGFNLRHHAVLKRMKKIIEEGTLGRVFLAECREYYDGGRTYMSRWNRLFSNTGGLWIHKGSHDFDVLNWLLGFPKPLRVSSFAAVNALTPAGIPFPLEAGHEPGPSCKNCYYANKCKDRYALKEDEYRLFSEEAAKVDGYIKDRCMYLSDKDNHDNGLSIVEYENNIKISMMECFICSKNGRIYTLIGDRGLAEVDLEARTITVIPRWHGEKVTYHVNDEKGGHGGADPKLVDTFCRVLRGEIAAPSTAEHGLLATAIGLAAEISRREHRMVEMSELLG